MMRGISIAHVTSLWDNQSLDPHVKPILGTTKSFDSPVKPTMVLTFPLSRTRHSNHTVACNPSFWPLRRQPLAATTALDAPACRGA